MTNNPPTQRRATADEVESARKSFGNVLRAAREHMGLSQADLAARISKSRVVISNYENGNAAPEPDQAVVLARTLREDPAEFVLLAALQRGLAGPDAATHNDLLNTVNGLRTRLGRRPLVAQEQQLGLPESLSLADGIAAFHPMVIFVGDKREEEPQMPATYSSSQRVRWTTVGYCHSGCPAIQRKYRTRSS